MRKRQADERRLQRQMRHEFVLRPSRRPGSVCEEVEANSVRMAREAREAESCLQRERRAKRGRSRGSR
jgi:hypothetical protein